MVWHLLFGKRGQGGAVSWKYIWLCSLLGIVLASVLTPNKWMRGIKRENLPQYQFKDIICEKENPKLLNYGFLDGGFYTVCNIIPDFKFFCDLNIPLDEIQESQRYYVENRLVDFVVVRDSVLEDGQYECVAECPFQKDGWNVTYYLYCLRARD